MYLTGIAIIIMNISIIVIALWHYKLHERIVLLTEIMERQEEINKINLQIYEDIDRCFKCLLVDDEDDRQE